MANQEHLDILQLGADVWNKWRDGHRDIRPDLGEADLRSVNLSLTDLSNAYIRDADLTDADLGFANLTDADLRNANLGFALLRNANLTNANLTSANLTSANLTNANLTSANLTNADFQLTCLGGTIFGNVDLRAVRGLENVIHIAPSSIGIDSIYSSQGTIPEAFLKGVGMDVTYITYIRSLVGKPIEYYSCFISYSSKDDAFAKRLYADLQSHNVRCWFAPEDLDIGDKIRPRIEESIRLYDKLLLVLSENSISSNWVAYEVERALNKEPAGVANVLYPIRLDDAVKHCNTVWANDIRSTRNIGDFSNWKNLDDYQKAFDRLLRALKAKAPRRL